jgi:hypothetical protein
MYMLLMAPAWTWVSAPNPFKWKFTMMATVNNYIIMGGTDVAAAYTAGKITTWIFDGASLAIPPVDTTVLTDMQFNALLISVITLSALGVWRVCLGGNELDTMMITNTSATQTKWKVPTSVIIYNMMVIGGYWFMYLTTGANFLPEPLFILATYLPDLTTNSVPQILQDTMIPITAVTIACAFLYDIMAGMWENSRWFVKLERSLEIRGGGGGDALIDDTTADDSERGGGDKGGDDDDEEDEGDEEEGEE